MATRKVEASLTDNGRIRLDFEYDPSILERTKQIPGVRFTSRDRGGPFWSFPKELELALTMNRLFGKELQITAEIKEWSGEQMDLQKTLMEMALAEDAVLELVPELVPEIDEAAYPFQRAGIAYAAKAPAPLLADQPGLGKTLQAIGAVFEAGLDEGKHLVIAPLTSLESVWLTELDKWQPHAVWVASGPPSVRRDAIEEFLEYEYPAWLVINHAMAQLVRNRKDGTEVPRWPQLYDILWDSIILDECHKAGLRNENSLTARGLKGLSCDGKRIAISGTPMGGRPINLWPILRFLHPQEFTSKWRFAEQWLTIETTNFGKKIGAIKPNRKKEFDRYITPYMLRRTKLEVLPQLPPKQYVPLWVDMGKAQKEQYDQFAAAAEVKIEEEKLTATSILAEYLRLKQFAIAHSRIRWIDQSEGRFKLSPAGESCKLDALQELLDERGLFPEADEEQDTEEQVVIFSQFSEVVDWIYDWLTTQKKVKALKITGGVTQTKRNEAMKEFQEGDGAKIIVMTTTAGGVAITLDNADTVIFMDETWVPDDQEQAEDRVHRASRIHQVTTYYIRTKGTIEEYIHKMVGDKQNVNTQILDLRRDGLRAV